MQNLNSSKSIITMGTQLYSALELMKLLGHVHYDDHVTYIGAGDGLVSCPDPPPKRKGGSGEYSTSSHHGLAVAMDSARS